MDIRILQRQSFRKFNGGARHFNKYNHERKTILHWRVSNQRRIIWQEILPNGRYDEARGNRKSAYTGNYLIKGDYLEYVDDTGCTADGDFCDGVLHPGGYVFYREIKEVNADIHRTDPE